MTERITPPLLKERVHPWASLPGLGVRKTGRPAKKRPLL